MSVNVQAILNQSLTLVGRLGAGRTAGNAESLVSLAIANNLLDSWSTKRLTVYTIVSNQWPLVASTESYTIGTGGTFDTARPTVVESANIVASVESSTARFPLRMIGQAEFAGLETFSDTSIIPKMLYNDNGFPLATLYLFPIPATNTHLELYTWQAFTQFTAPAGTLTTAATAVTWVSGTKFDASWVGGTITINAVAYTISSVTSSTALVLSATAGIQTGVAFSTSPLLAVSAFPPGYARAYQYNLAVELAAAFGLKVPDVVLQIAEASKDSIEAVNARLTPQPEIGAQAASEKQTGNKR